MIMCTSDDVAVLHSTYCKRQCAHLHRVSSNINTVNAAQPFTRRAVMSALQTLMNTYAFLIPLERRLAARMQRARIKCTNPAPSPINSCFLATGFIII